MPVLGSTRLIALCSDAATLMNAKALAKVTFRQGSGYISM